MNIRTGNLILNLDTECLMLLPTLQAHWVHQLLPCWSSSWSGCYCHCIMLDSHAIVSLIASCASYRRESNTARLVEKPFLRSNFVCIVTQSVKFLMSLHKCMQQVMYAWFQLWATTLGLQLNSSKLLYSYPACHRRTERKSACMPACQGGKVFIKVMELNKLIPEYHPATSIPSSHFI